MFAIVYTNAENETALWQLVFFISGLAAGLREELFYRGMIRKTLQMKYGYRNALIFGAPIFTLAHLQYLYQGQFRELALIAFAGIIFGSIFIHTDSVLFAGLVHGLYDAILSVNLVPFRLSYNASLPILFLITTLFLIIISNKLCFQTRFRTLQRRSGRLQPVLAALFEAGVTDAASVTRLPSQRRASLGRIPCALPINQEIPAVSTPYGFRVTPANAFGTLFSEAPVPQQHPRQ